MKKHLIPLAVMATLLTTPAWADIALAKAKNCTACHSVDGRLVGPSFKSIAGKYAGDKAALDKLTVKVMQGGSGVWGANAMPANPQVNEAEARKLVAWILGLR